MTSVFSKHDKGVNLQYLSSYNSKPSFENYLNTHMVVVDIVHDNV